MEAHALTIQASTWPSIDSTMAESWRLLDVSPAACWDLSRGAQGALSPEFEPVLRWALAPVDLVHQLSQNRVKSLHPRGRNGSRWAPAPSCVCHLPAWRWRIPSLVHAADGIACHFGVEWVWEDFDYEREEGRPGQRTCSLDTFPPPIAQGGRR